MPGDLTEGEPAWHPLQPFYLMQFWELTTERQVGMALGQIPVSKIEERAEKIGLGDVATRIFKRVIRGMDDGFLAWAAKEKEKKM